MILLKHTFEHAQLFLKSPQSSFTASVESSNSLSHPSLSGLISVPWVSVILNSVVSQAPALLFHIFRPLNVPPTFLLEIPFLFLFAQREDSYLSSRPCPSGSPCLSGHDPSPKGGWELSYLCSHKHFDNTDYTTCCQTPSTPWRWALHSHTSDSTRHPGGVRESTWS